MSKSGPVIDLIGVRFGSLTVAKFIPGSHRDSAKWVCLCDCGQTRTNTTYQLNSGKSRSCGCMKRATIGDKKRTHGHTNGRISSRTYRIWTNMKTRCSNPNSSNFKHYGGRGISYDSSWDVFASFIADMGACPDGMTLERKDSNANYSKENCVWATHTDQMRNTSRTVWLDILGERICLPAAAERYGINKGTLWSRIKRGWSHSSAVGL